MSESKTKGRKFDSGKAEYGLIPPHALHAMVEVLTVGAQKYARDNWKYVEDRERRYFDAMQRHIWAWKRGEINDPEDNLHHLAHAMCCLMFLHESSLYYKEGEVNGQTKSMAESSGATQHYGTSSGYPWTTGSSFPKFISASSGGNVTIPGNIYESKPVYQFADTSPKGSTTSDSDCSRKYHWEGIGSNFYRVTFDK